jgi:hypothetical protein
MASTPDLAGAIRELHLLVDYDYTMVVQKANLPERLDNKAVAISPQDLSIQLDKQQSTQAQRENDSISSKKRVTHAFDSITGTLVPATYLKHRAALIVALRACKNVTDLWIGNRPFEPGRMHHYKCSSRRNGIGPPPEDGGNLLGGSEGGYDDVNASDDASEDGEDSTNDDDSESNNGGESEGNVHDEGNDDAEEQDQASVGHAEENDNAAQGTEHHDETVLDYRDLPFDITLLYNYVL